MSDKPTEDPDKAGTAPVDPTNIVPHGGNAEADADAAGAEGAGAAEPVGGEAIARATAPNGEDPETDAV